MRGPQPDALPSTVNGDPVDHFTFAHLGVGAIMGAVKLPWWAALGIAIGWELIENPLKDRFSKLFPHPSHDRPANAVVDAAAMMAGWGIARGLRRVS